MKINQKIKNIFEKKGIYLSKQPKKYEELISNIRDNLVESSNVLHIGAHYGQEIQYYKSKNANVIWVEANPQVYEVLESNLKDIQNQVATLALLGNKHGVKTPFYLSSNELASSSIYNFGEDVGLVNLRMTGKMYLEMKRLDKIFSVRKLKGYNHWVIDVQGAELDVCKGAGNLLTLPSSLEVEVSTREEYHGGTIYKELRKYLYSFGFSPLWDPKDNSHENIIFVKTREEQ